MQDQRGARDLGHDVLHVDAVEGVQQTDGVGWRSRASHKVIVRATLLYRCIRDVQRGEELTVTWIFVCPAEFIDFEPCLCLCLLLSGWAIAQRATGIAATKDKVGDPSRMVDHVSHGDRTAASTHAEQHEAIKACSRNNGIQVLGVFVERKLHALAVGKATAPPVVTDQCVMPRQQGQPGSPDRAIPVVFQVVSPKLHPHQRGTRAASRIGDARAVGARTEANFLLGLRHADRTLGRS